MRKLLAICILLVSLPALAQEPVPTGYKVSFIVAVGKTHAQVTTQLSNGGTAKVTYALTSAGTAWQRSQPEKFWLVEGSLIGGEFVANGRFFNSDPIYSGQPVPGHTTPKGQASGGNWVGDDGQTYNPETGQPETSGPPAPGSSGNPYNPPSAGGGSVGGSSGGGTSNTSGPGRVYRKAFDIVNTFGFPCAFNVRWVGTGVNASLVKFVVTRVCQPGEKVSILIEENYAFNVDYTPIVDGIPNEGGNVDLGGAGEENGSGPGVGTTPGTTQPLDPVRPAGQGDTYGAVNRVGEIMRAYGEAARTGQNIANNNLEKIKGLFDQAVNKLNQIASNTAGGGGSGGSGGTGGGDGDGSVTIEGDALAALQSIDSKMDDQSTPPDLEEVAVVPEGDDKSGEITRIREAWGEIAGKLQGTINSLGLGPTLGNESWTFTIPTPFEPVVLDLEGWFGSFLTTFRGVILAFVSINFVRRLIAAIRGSMVDASPV